MIFTKIHVRKCQYLKKCAEDGIATGKEDTLFLLSCIARLIRKTKEDKNTIENLEKKISAMQSADKLRQQNTNKEPDFANLFDGILGKK